MKKRVIAFFTAVAVACTSTTAYAHVGDYWSGYYKYDLQKNMYFVVQDSAFNSLFTKDTFENGVFWWNRISSNVNVSIAYEGETTDLAVPYNRPTIVQEACKVIGKSNLEIRLYLGLTVPYDTNGDPMEWATEAQCNKTWTKADIWLNTTEAVFKRAKDPAEAAKHTFIHEVGHSLKLSHPVCDPSLKNHGYGDGYPFSVMNTGFPYNQNDGHDGATCPVPTFHDNLNLRAKWGE